MFSIDALKKMDMRADRNEPTIFVGGAASFSVLRKYNSLLNSD